MFPIGQQQFAGEDNLTVFIDFLRRRTTVAVGGVGIAALASSRTLFFLFHDPEGPNLLIVMVLAVMLYITSFIVWRFVPATTAKKLLLAIGAQVVIVTA